MFNHVGVTNVEDSIYQLSMSYQRSTQRFTLSLANLLVRALTVCTYLFNPFKIYLTVYDNELSRYSNKPTILYSNHTYYPLQIGVIRFFVRSFFQDNLCKRKLI